jgi:hypothetical protein
MKNGFKSTRKCIREKVWFDIKEILKDFCEDYTLRYFKPYSIKQSSTSNDKLKKFMNTQSSCDKTAAKVIVTLCHYLRLDKKWYHYFFQKPIILAHQKFRKFHLFEKFYKKN